MPKNQSRDGDDNETPTGVNRPQRSPDELRRALEECTREVKRLKAVKKSRDEDHNGLVKEQELEIASILDQLRG